jgi:hypothetical protein
MPLRTTKTWWGVVLDAPDGPALAHFYARLLGWQVFNENATGAAVAPSEDAGYDLGFETEQHYARPVWPTQETVRVMLDPAGHPFCLYLDT